MSTLKLSGDVSGYAELRTNSAAGTVIVTMPLVSGNLIVSPLGTPASPANGQVLIGNTVSGGYDLNTLTQGTGIVITNTKGAIEISATGGSATDQYARDKANGAVQTGFPTIVVATQSDIVADSNTDTLTVVAGSGIAVTTDAGTDTLTITHPTSGVSATGYGDAATIPVFVVDARGHLTSVTNTAIAISATQITSGTLAVARGGTGQTAITVNGSLLIGNTVSGGFDVNPITQGTNITITNDKGSITIAATGGGGPGFGDIQISGQDSVVADQANDVLTLVAGTGVTITSVAGTDTITLSAADAFASAQANAAFNAANAASTLGLHTMWIPAWAMYPQLTNGASAANGLFEMTTNLQMLKTLDFDTTTAENAQFAISMPNSWDEGTITANAVWSHNVTTVNFGVTWTLEGRAYSDNEAIDQAFGTPVPTSDTGGTANTVYITPPTSAITIAGTPTAGDWIIFRVSRQVANASDTMAIDARLHGVQIKYTTAASTEA